MGYHIIGAAPEGVSEEYMVKDDSSVEQSKTFDYPPVSLT
jgi:hypothetical protein